MKRQASRESRTGRRTPPTCRTQAEWLQQPASFIAAPEIEMLELATARDAILGCSKRLDASSHNEMLRTARN
jgi:hypothetical protein